MTSLPRRSSKKPTSTGGEHEFPALFTIDGSSRHEIILVNPGVDLGELKQTIEKLSVSSPNAVEFMYKFKSKEATESIKEIRVKWASEGRDKQLFPRETVLTEENCEPVLRMMAVGVGKDVFDIKMQSKQVEGSK